MTPVTKNLNAYIGTTFGPIFFTFNQTRSIPLGVVGVDPSTDFFTLIGHGLSNGDQVRFTTTAFLPTPLSEGVYYYIVNASAGAFKVALTAGGAAINITDTGSGAHTVVKRGVPLDLTGWHVRSWAKHEMPCDDSIWIDLLPTITDAPNGQVQLFLADSATLLWKPADLVYSIILENTAADWLGPFVVGKLTVRSSPTDSGDPPPVPA